MKPVFVVLCVALAATFGPAHCGDGLITGSVAGWDLSSPGNTRRAATP